MNKPNMISMILSLTLAMFALNTAQALSEPGVKVGDWMRYDVTVSYLGNTSFSESFRLTVQNVQGPVVNGTFVTSVPGFGDVSTTDFTVNVATGGGANASGFMIPANLTVGQAIPGQGVTVDLIVSWGGRQAINVNTSVPYFEMEGNVYWDQATGILLESSSTTMGMTYKISLVETSLWSTGLFGGGIMMWIIVIVIVVVVVALTVVLIMRKRKAKIVSALPEKDLPPPPPPPP